MTQSTIGGPAAQRALALPPMHVRQAGRIAALTAKRKEMARTASLAAVAAPIPRPRDVPTPKDYGAKGWPADDSASLQQMLDAGGRVALDAPYMCTQPLAYGADTYVDGRGFRLHNPNSAQVVLYNRNAVYSGETRADQNVTFDSVDFSRDLAAPVTGIENIVCIGVGNLRFLDCTFRDSNFYGVTLSNCRGVYVIRPRFVNIGDTRKFSALDSGSWWGGVGLFCVTANYDMWVIDPLFRGLRGIGAWFDQGGKNLVVRGMVGDGVVENLIFGAPPGSDIEIVSGENSVRADVSGHIAEMVGNGWTLRLGRVRKIDGAVVYLSEVQDARVIIGDADDANRSWNHWVGGGMIMVRNYDPAPTAGCKRIQVSASLAASTGYGMHPVSLVNWSGNPSSTMEDIDIDCRYGNPAQWKNGGGAFGVDPPGGKLLVRPKGIALPASP